MSRKNRNSGRNRAFYEPVLEGFAGQYDIELSIFGSDKLHYRLQGSWATLDVWPTTGKFYIKVVPLGTGFSTEDRGGTLPQDYNKIDKFLRALFNVKE